MKKSKILMLSSIFLGVLATLCACGTKKDKEDTKPVITEKGDKGDKGDPGDSGFIDNATGLWFYPQSDGTLGVSSGFAYYLTDITVPSTFNGKTVSKVIDDGFYGCENLSSIHLPSTITTIGNYAFEDCEKLETIYLGDSQLDTYVSTERSQALIGTNVNCGDNCFSNTNLSSIDLEDVNDSTEVTVNLSNLNKDITGIKITAALNDITDTISEEELDLTKDSQTIDFLTYGLFKNIKVEVSKGENKYETTTSGVGVTASHYNFAHLNATYPVLVFSLKAKEITADGTIPTFVTLERYQAYDWDNLTYSLSTLPYLKKQDAIKKDFHSQRAGIVDYIKELYELNSDSQFTLYCNDLYPELILQYLVANNIPESNWDAVILSDGSGTAAYLSYIYDVNNPSDRYDEMALNWEAIKEYTYKNGFNPNKIIEFDYTLKQVSYLFYYSYAISKEQDNVVYWTGRLRANENLSAVSARDPEFAQSIVNNVTVFYTNSLLAALSPEDALAFKSLYHFNGEMFEIAEEENKDVMIILGTSWGNEQGSFYDYIRITMDYYGDDYIYYYKGHPGWPTSTSPARKVELDKLKEDGYILYELDASIAAEVILFFYPTVYVSGWDSTTFQSVDSQTMACMTYNIDKDVTNHPYHELMDSFIVKLASESTTYEGINLDSTHQYYVVKFNNEDYQNQQEAYTKHEIAIYDATAKVLKYYKNNGTSYEETTK